MQIACVCDWYVCLLSPNNTLIGGEGIVCNFSANTKCSLIEEMLLPVSNNASWDVFPILISEEHTNRVEELAACMWGWRSPGPAPLNCLPAILPEKQHLPWWFVHFDVDEGVDLVMSLTFCSVVWHGHTGYSGNIGAFLGHLCPAIVDEHPSAHFECRYPLG